MEGTYSLPAEVSADAETILFRPSKKRKIYRQRAADDDENAPITAPTATNLETPAQVVNMIESGNAENMEGTEVSMAEILRLRKLRKRVGGVEFRVEPTSSTQSDAAALALADGDREGYEAAEVEGGEVEGPPVARRFAKQTGMVGDVDKHMMAYIDSELAKRRQNVSDPTSKQSLFGKSSSSTGRIGSPEAAKSSKDVERQPASLGKIQEIDLGSEASHRNAIMTERARRKAAGEEDAEEEMPGKPKKVRLGRDGKPWRSKKKRRTSEDIRRDALVEAVLSENRIEMYEEPTPQTQNEIGNGDNDDAIAEAFRREFMDAVSQRQRKKPVAAPPARGPGGKKEEELKGPKLGGSRSARAAMREMQLKAQKK